MPLAGDPKEVMGFPGHPPTLGCSNSSDPRVGGSKNPGAMG